MTQAIRTRYLGPTNHRGSRIIASCEAGRMAVPWRYESGIEDNHAYAADVLRRKLGWKGTWATGSLPDGTYVHVWVIPEVTR